jgi:hypothetical protein
VTTSFKPIRTAGIDCSFKRHVSGPPSVPTETCSTVAVLPTGKNVYKRLPGARNGMNCGCRCCGCIYSIACGVLSRNVPVSWKSDGVSALSMEERWHDSEESAPGYLCGKNTREGIVGTKKDNAGIRLICTRCCYCKRRGGLVGCWHLLAYSCWYGVLGVGFVLLNSNTRAWKRLATMPKLCYTEQTIQQR